MRCLREKTLQESLDGELSEARRRGIDRHLSRCGRCERRLAAWKEQNDFVRAKLSSLDPSEIPKPPGLAPERGPGELARKRGFRKIYGATIRVPTAALAMASLFLIGFSLGTSIRNGSEEGSRARKAAKRPAVVVSTADQVQVLPLGLDLADYEPIADPRVIVIKEDQP
jgi:anti-sigma factor RsiW